MLYASSRPQHESFEGASRGPQMAADSKSLFISHSSQDKAVVNQLIVKLREAGVENLWYDVFDVGPTTDDLNERIKDGIRAADYFAIVLSPASQASQWVSYEVQEALVQNKLVLALVFDAPRGHYDFLRNPHTSDLLRGGRRKVIDFSADFDKAFNELLLVVAPKIGKERAVGDTLNRILKDPDPDNAERAMSVAALDADAYLPPLLKMLPELRNDATTLYRVAQALAHVGQKALNPLFAHLFLLEPVKSEEIPSEIPHDGSSEDGWVTYAGGSFSDVLRHLILTGGNRAWAAQIGAGRCLVAMAERESTLRPLIRSRLNECLSAAIRAITVSKHEGIFTDDFYDMLRMTIETAASVEQPPTSLDPWLIQQFCLESLWGSDQSQQAKDKLGSCVVDCLSRIGSQKALERLLELSEDREIIELFFALDRAPNPWDECFTRFGNMAVDPLIDRLQGKNASFRPFILRNLSLIPNVRGLSVVMDAVESHQEADPLHLSKLLLRVASRGVPALSDRLLSRFEEYRTYLGAQSDLELSYVERAGAVAARSASDRAVATRVCEELCKSRDRWTIVEVINAIADQHIYPLLGFVRSLFQNGPTGAIRGVAAIALSKMKEVKAADIVSRLGEAEEATERPYLCLALAELRDPAAQAGLVDGLKSSFKRRDWAEHDLYATALTQLGTPEAEHLRMKWYKRI